MLQNNRVLIGKGEHELYLMGDKVNRHGLIAGATGTGKTVTLKVLAEGLSDMGVPVFLADVKGDVSSMCLAGEKSEKIVSRLNSMGIDPDSFNPKSYPCRFWDVFGTGGVPVRAKVSDVGPVIISRLLGLTEVQTGVLNIVFHVADDLGWQLIDYKDLKAMLMYIAEHRAELTTAYGNVTSQSIGAIQRALLTLEDEGAEQFFGEPDLDINDWFRQTEDGRGYVNILHCVELAQRPTLYAAFMLWMLGELYEKLPEVGDLDKPKFVFFFDEAHMLFNDAPKSMVDKVTQVVKLIRSKGVGIYFITQSPSDIPNEVLAQLNNRILHALRAYTPAEQKAIRAAAQGFRPNPAFKTEDAIAELGTGEALVSMLGEDGAPCIVEKATICPPQSSFTALENAARAMLVAQDPAYQAYKDAVDNLSAYEYITDEMAAEQEKAAAEQAEKEQAAAARQAEKEAKAAEKAAAAAAREEARAAREQEKALQEQYKAEGRDKYGRTKMQASLEKAAKSAVKSESRSIGRKMGKSITRGILGNSNNAAGRLVGNAAGSLMSDLIGGFFKR
ncbi:MAG: DUF853 family protein [Lachnospiraceae bacterium]|nr:DUF853 family protein [Lachnospiraceae bacterium]